MKIALSFISGILLCGLILFGVKSVIPTQAQTDNSTDNLSEQSETLTQSLINLLPDVEKIYHDSLTMPFRKAESKIYDNDIAEFYQELLDNTVLNESGDGAN